MTEPTEDLDRLSNELRQIADEIAELKKKMMNMEPGPERRELSRLIRQKQNQALFYADKITNIGRELRSRK